MTMICSKFRLQIKNRNKLQWFGPIFCFLGGAMMKVVPCYAQHFRLKLKKIGPNCNGLVLFLFVFEI